MLPNLFRMQTAWIVTMTMLLIACAAFEKPQNFEQQLAYAYSTHTALLDAAANAVTSGAMTPDEGEHVLNLADDSKIILDGAKLAYKGGDVTTAQGQLALATAVLTQLRDYLNQQLASGR